MTSPPLDQPGQPSLLRPSITRLPDADATAPRGDAPRSLVVRYCTCGRYPAPLPAPVTRLFWTIAAGACAVGGWSAAVLTQQASCRGVVCRIATLGDRPVLLLALAAFCVVTLVALAPVTDGLTRAGRPERAVMVVAAAAGTVSVLGVVAVAALAVLLALMGAVVLVILLDRD